MTYPSLKCTHFNFVCDECVMASIYVKVKELSANCNHRWLLPMVEIGMRWLLNILPTHVIQWFCFHYGNRFTQFIPGIYSMKEYSIYNVGLPSWDEMTVTWIWVDSQLIIIFYHLSMMIKITRGLRFWEGLKKWNVSQRRTSQSKLCLQMWRLGWWQS